LPEILDEGGSVRQRKVLVMQEFLGDRGTNFQVNAHTVIVVA
jgi:hypothetical protein